MLLTITNTRTPATDLGYLLHKNPVRTQSFALPFGKAHVFYPEASPERCTAALALEVDPVGLVRGRGSTLGQYVNDRPYAASSFLSVAISAYRAFRVGLLLLAAGALVYAVWTSRARRVSGHGGGGWRVAGRPSTSGYSCL